ncbi:hypothetical protein K443DRAFT_679272 [Laccaria amethystina LaAM-08-1]|uniref:Uncharacterized protein n=1 Tax=Laccaria amethystina LaAM-08-1 TaxID=1095629 RepID=A0A0C9XF65_9AGAR|nr:hypothetical protein K443DRAFT_679272 [Laccaria amethystina LaAM-08-1]
MAPAPYLQQAAELALGILNIVQGAKDNRDAFQKLAADTCELLYVVLSMSGEAFEEGDNRGLIDNLQDLLGALSSTKRFLLKETSRGPAARLLRKKADLGQVQKCRGALRRPLNKLFQSNVAMRKALLKLEHDKDSEEASGSVSAPAAVDKELPPVPPILQDETSKPSVTATHFRGDKVNSYSLSNTNSGNINTMPMFEGATGVTVSGGSFDDVFGDMVINDSSSHTTNHGSFNATNETYNSGSNSTRNDFSRIFPVVLAHNFRAGTVNNYNGAKNMNPGNYGTTNQNDHRGAMPSREPYALQSYNYERSRGQGSRPPIHHTYSAPPAGHHYDGQYYNGYQHSAYGRPGDARRYEDRARYRPPPQESHPYPVLRRDEEFPSWTIYPGDVIYSDEGEEFNPHGAYALSAEGYTPASHPRSKSDVVASAACTSYASLQSGPPRMKSNNPFRKG